MSNQELYNLCKKYGAAALEARRKFAGLLPEVYKRQLYKKKGFGSIYEFAARLAGMSREQVQRVLQLERKFDDKPVLKEMLVNGKESINKLARVASIVTPENQEEIAAKVKVLSKSAVETFVKDYTNENRIQQPLIDDVSVPGHRLELDEDIENQLAELQQKGIDVNEFLRECLQKRTQEISEEKEKLANEAKPTKSRYIKADVKRIIQKEHGTKCSVPGCNKPARVLHHTRRFALSPIHDPNYLAPQCHEHHEISHSIDQKFHQSRQRAIEFI